jgi:hypothetical protein
MEWRRRLRRKTDLLIRIFPLEVVKTLEWGWKSEGDDRVKIEICEP